MNGRINKISLAMVTIILALAAYMVFSLAGLVQAIRFPPQPLVVVPPVPSQPATSTPAPTPTREPLPVLTVEWVLMPDAPTAHALFVLDGVLYAVEDTPSGCITWGYENDAWTSRPATADESQLVVDRAWYEFPIVIEVLGDTAKGYGAKVSSEISFVTTRGIIPPDDLRSVPHLYLYMDEWTEINTPIDGIAYGLVSTDGALYASIEGKIWQALLPKNLP
ncbi:MAG: hypothetical protein AB1345_11525 [Chloroflexota bacterium]